MAKRGNSPLWPLSKSTKKKPTAMLNESLLWTRTISPTGRIMKDETFLGAFLKALAIFSLGALLGFLIVSL
jgi:hypothetical protein